MSANLFDWNARETWLAEVPEYAGAFLTKQVQAKIAKSRPKFWSDDFAWLPVADGEEKFAAAFAAYYRHIRAFHGCRPVSLQSYFAEGLRGQTTEAIEAQFLDLFSDVPQQALHTALADFQDRKRAERGKFWVVLEENELIETCGHYLIQGSEYLMGLAATLCRLAPGEDYHLRLRSSGTPTVFELHISTDHLPENQVNELSRLVLSVWGERTAQRPLRMGDNPCLTVEQTIDAKYLVAHTHPRHIPDPHSGYAIYVNDRTECPHCTNAAT